MLGGSSIALKAASLGTDEPTACGASVFTVVGSEIPGGTAGEGAISADNTIGKSVWVRIVRVGPGDSTVGAGAPVGSMLESEVESEVES